jgi:hypothetical protein
VVVNDDESEEEDDDDETSSLTCDSVRSHYDADNDGNASENVEVEQQERSASRIVQRRVLRVGETAADSTNEGDVESDDEVVSMADDDEAEAEDENDASDEVMEHA